MSDSVFKTGEIAEAIEQMSMQDFGWFIVLISKKSAQEEETKDAVVVPLTKV